MALRDDNIFGQKTVFSGMMSTVSRIGGVPHTWPLHPIPWKVAESVWLVLAALNEKDDT